MTQNSGVVPDAAHRAALAGPEELGREPPGDPQTGGLLIQVIEEAAINDAQKAAVRQVLTHARGGQDIIVEQLTDGTVRVTRTTLGGAGGRAEYVTDIALDGSRKTVQYGYSSSGELVHEDPQ